MIWSSRVGMFEAWFRSIVVGGTGKEGETGCHHRRYYGDEKDEEDEKGKLWVAVWYLRFSPASCEECGMMRLHSNTLFTILFSCLTASYLPQTGSPYPTLVFSWLLHQAERERERTGGRTPNQRSLTRGFVLVRLLLLVAILPTCLLCTRP